MYNFPKFILLMLLFAFPVLSFAQRTPVSATVTTSTGDPVTSYSACASSLLALQANCDGDDVAWIGSNGFLEPELSSVLVPVTAGAVSYTVVCYYTDGGRYEGAPATFTIVGNNVGCSQTCNVTPDAVNFQPVGVLNGETCSIDLSAQVTGKAFVFTGPNGYQYSVVYSTCQEGTTIVAKNVKEPGIYTLTAYNDALPPKSTLRDLPSGSFTITLQVGGTACPTR